VALAATLFGGAFLAQRSARAKYDRECRPSFGRRCDVTTSGDVTIDASEGASISALSVAAAVSASFDEAVSGGASEALNTIDTDTSAFVESSTLNTGGAISIDADDTSTANATTGTAAVALALFSVAAGGSVTIDTITNDVNAYIDNSTVLAGSNAVSVTASAQPEAVANAYGIAAGALSVGVAIRGRDRYAFGDRDRSTATLRPAAFRYRKPRLAERRQCIGRRVCRRRLWRLDRRRIQHCRSERRRDRHFGNWRAWHDLRRNRTVLAVSGALLIVATATPRRRPIRRTQPLAWSPAARAARPPIRTTPPRPPSARRRRSPPAR